DVLSATRPSPVRDSWQACRRWFVDQETPQQRRPFQPVRRFAQISPGVSVTSGDWCLIAWHTKKPAPNWTFIITASDTPSLSGCRWRSARTTKVYQWASPEAHTHG